MELIKLDYREIFVFSCLFIINVLLMSSPLSFVVTAIQALTIFYLLYRDRVHDAAFWHFIFIMTSFAVSGGDDEIVLKTGYFSTKLIGPVTLSYLISIIILLFTFNKTQTRSSLGIFSKMLRVFVYFMVSGVFFGAIGCLFKDYFINTFIAYTVYITIIIVHILILKNLSNEFFIRKCYKSVISILIAALFSTIFNWAIGLRSEYSIYEMTISSAVADFSILLFLFLPQFKNKILVLILLLGHLFVLITTGASGKFFLNAGVVGIAFVFSLIKQKGFNFSYLLALGVFALLLGSNLIVEDSLFSRKLNQFLSLGSLASGSVEDVGTSPYIRVASLLNIYLENIKNPLYFIFGRGYGGYFQDSLGLFEGWDLSEGAFADDAIRLGKFPTAHTTFNMVPLLNGFVGLFLVFKLVWSYFKRSITGSPLALTAVLWLLFMFYFNIQIGIIGVFLLYASEYNQQINIIKTE